jgi:hypothetical protein
MTTMFAREGQEPQDPPFSAVAVELVMDSYRVIGELRGPGGPRRLVDILNAVDSSFILVYDGQVDDPLAEDDEPREFEIVQLHLNTLLFAIPRGSLASLGNPLEAVRKSPVAATIALPGFEVTGNIFLLPDADPKNTALMGSRHFIPMTDATVTSAFNRNQVWREDIVVINLARAVLFAPRRTKDGAPGTTLPGG